MNPIINEIKRRAPEYGSLPFWSWNDKLEEEELRAQIRRMKSLHMGGFFMHARGGLETEYLSDEWFRCINACIDEAKKQGMEAWAYDENGWPSGFAGGVLLQDPANHATMLRYEFVSALPPADEDTVAVYRRNGDSYTRVETPQVAGSDGEPYLRLYMAYDDSYVDTLNPEVTDRFIEATHEEYKKRIPKEAAGGVMPGFFTDEPQYYRWGCPYSRTLPAAFREAYGYELTDGLPALFFDFEGAEKLRYDYYMLIHRRFTEGFVGKLYRWCEENGMQITGHAVEETSLAGQMMCCGGVMPFYEYEHIPGMDYLCRWLSEDIAPKQLGSVCAQLGKKKALSEMFAACGWDVTPVELKRIADLQYAGGVNLMCQHLYPYSERGQRKRDYPHHYSDHSPWQEEFAAFCTHYNHLGAALSEGEEYAPVLVIHPMHGAYMKYIKERADSLAEIDGKLIALSRLLGANQVPYHYGDEWLMEKHAAVENGKIRVGSCTYEAVVVPFTYSLDGNTVRLLKEYMAEGGRVWLFDAPPACVDGVAAEMRFTSTCTLDDIFALRDGVLTRADGAPVPELRKTVRVTPHGKVLFVTNLGEAAVNGVTLTLDATYLTHLGSMAEVDLMTLREMPVCGRRTAEGFTLTLDFEGGESHLLVPSALPLAAESVCKAHCPTIPLPEEMTLTELPVNMLTLDNAALSLNGTDYEEPLALMGIKDNLLREQYNGDLWLRFTYEATEDYLRSARALCLVTEPMNILSVTVNGKATEPLPGEWWFDRSFRVTDILPLTVAGKNEIVIRLHHWQSDHVYRVLYGGVSEALRNCLAFDTEIENLYLTGDFRLRCDGTFTAGEGNAVLYEGGFVLDRQRDTCRVGNLVTDGYPFYAGRIRAGFTYTYGAGKPTMLRLGGRYAVCRVTVNGREAGVLLFSAYLDLGDYLTEGENHIELELCSSNRNLMGPHHHAEPEPFAACPTSFSFENEWNGRECASYRERYAFVRFGV